MRLTRRHRALELLNVLQQGPAFRLNDSEAEREIVRQYQLWCKTWILPEVKQLIPELREEKDLK